MGRIIGIDLGLRRSGIAIADSMVRIASPFETLDPKALDVWLQGEILKADVDCIVVGLPQGLDGQETDMTEHVKRWIKKTSDRFPDLVIHTVDERFTSKMAKASLLQSGAKKMKRRDKGILDRMSAALMLQDWLDWHAA